MIIIQTSDPIHRILQHLQQSLLPAPLLRLVHIHPAGLQRQAHQDTFDPGSRRGEAKRSAAVVNKVKLDIAPPAQLLPLLFLRREGHVFPPSDDGEIGWEKGPGAVLRKAEYLLWVVFRGVKVVEEDAADAARFFAVRDVEVLVTPGFEAWVITPVMFIAGFFDGPMKMNGVFVKEIGGRQIGSAAEPPSVSIPIRVHRFK